MILDHEVSQREERNCLGMKAFIPAHGLKFACGSPCLTAVLHVLTCSASPHNHIGQFLVMNFLIHKYICIIFYWYSFSGTET